MITDRYGNDRSLILRVGVFVLHSIAGIPVAVLIGMLLEAVVGDQIPKWSRSFSPTVAVAAFFCGLLASRIDDDLVAEFVWVIPFITGLLGVATRPPGPISEGIAFLFSVMLFLAGLFYGIGHFVGTRLKWTRTGPQ